MTQQQLADTIAAITSDSIPPISKATIINLEIGKKADMTTTDLLAFSAALKITPLALLFDLDKPFDEFQPKLMRKETISNVFLLDYTQLPDYNSADLEKMKDSSIPDDREEAGIWRGRAAILTAVRSFYLAMQLCKDYQSDTETQKEYISFYIKRIRTGLEQLKFIPHNMRPPYEDIMHVQTVYDELTSSNTK